jgi:hypothetical protein
MVDKKQETPPLTKHWLNDEGVDDRPRRWGYSVLELLERREKFKRDENASKDRNRDILLWYERQGGYRIKRYLEEVVEQYLQFPNRVSYLCWRAEWRSCLKFQEESVRQYKRLCRSRHANERANAQALREMMRNVGFNLLVLRMASKVRAARLYEENRKEEHERA